MIRIVKIFFLSFFKKRNNNIEITITANIAMIVTNIFWTKKVLVCVTSTNHNA